MTPAHDERPSEGNVSRINSFLFFCRFLPRELALEAWAHVECLQTTRPLTGKKYLARLYGLVPAMRAGRLGNSKWGRSMLARRGYKAMVQRLGGLPHVPD